MPDAVRRDPAASVDDGPPAEGAGRRPPNVLVVITDQQRADHVGFAGNPDLRTPNLDALAARSTVFDRAYVANPVCSPNRSSILTGRMPSSHGVIFNDRALPWGAETFVRPLREAGYRTALIGKSHLQLSVDREMVPRIGRDACADGFDNSVYGWEFAERFDGDEDPTPPADYYGFDHVEFATDHGARMAGHHLRWALAKGASRDDVVHPMGPDSPGDRRSPRWWQIYRPPYPAELHCTAFVAERTLAFIDEATSQDRPWMAWMAFPDPHHPLTPPGKWFDRHRAEDMTPPDTFGDPLDDAPPHIRAIRARTDGPLWVMPFGVDDPGLVREALAATYGMIEFIDAEVGRVLDHLEQIGVADDTIVVFTSDHGEMMGDHSLMLKGNLHYQGVLRVPLTVAAPGFGPARSTSLVSSLDIAPTMLELCGLRGHRGMHGESLRPLLDDPTVSVHDHLLVEDDVSPVIARLIGVPARMRTLMTADARFARDSDGFEQVFDLDSDPAETTDRSDDGWRRDEMHTALIDSMMAVDDVGGGISRDRAG